MTQKRMNQVIVGLAIAFVLALLMFVPIIRDLFFSFVLGLFVSVGPSVMNWAVRKIVIPYVDSKSKPEQGKKKSEYSDSTLEVFPMSIRVLFWLLVGAVVSLVWIPLMPAILSLPLGLNKLALDMGWESKAMADGATQYYWSLIFMAQYVGMFIFGAFAWQADFSYPRKND